MGLEKCVPRLNDTVNRRISNTLFNPNFDRIGISLRVDVAQERIGKRPSPLRTSIRFRMPECRMEPPQRQIRPMQLSMKLKQVFSFLKKRCEVQ